MKLAMNSAGGVFATGLVVILAACTPIQASPSASVSGSASASPTAVTPTPRSTPPKLTPAEQDLELAKAAIVQFWQVLDRVAADPESRINDMDRVARGAALRQAQEDLTAWRVAEYVLTGTRTVENATAKLTSKNRWTVTSCVDTSEIDVVDRKGKSVSGPPYRILRRSTVVKDSDSFYVTVDKAIETC